MTGSFRPLRVLEKKVCHRHSLLTGSRQSNDEGRSSRRHHHWLAGAGVAARWQDSSRQRISFRGSALSGCSWLLSFGRVGSYLESHFTGTCSKSHRTPNRGPASGECTGAISHRQSFFDWRSESLFQPTPMKPSLILPREPHSSAYQRTYSTFSAGRMASNSARYLRPLTV